MNKEVINIEPEDDITNVVTKIENAKERIVALVPPKNPAIFHSLVNIKLLHKAATTAGKTLVLVTTDASIVKLAAAVRLPVTKNLQSAPSIPTDSDAPSNTTTAEIATSSATQESESSADETSDKPTNTTDKPAADDKPSSDDKPTTKNQFKTKLSAFFQKYRRWCIIGGSAILVFILALIWVFAIAPAVKISVAVRTTNNNFSENISFTTKINEEDATIGKFYLEEKKLDTPSKVEFKATGSKNLGEKATGKINIYTYFKESGSIKIPKGSTFTNNGLIYTSTTDATLAWNLDNECKNTDPNSLVTEGCQITATVPVAATEPGVKYNITTKINGWSSNVSDIRIESNDNITGGTDKIVTVVQQSDIDKAKESLAVINEAELKAKLFESIGDSQLAIEASFAQKSGDIVSSPKVGEEVGENVTPSISTTNTISVYVIDKTKVEEFISAKAHLADDQKIYKLGNPFIENFLSIDNGYAGKLKTSYSTGPKVTEEDIMNKSKGKKIGEVQSLLKSINGVGSVSIKKSFFWVNSVPDNPNKITINLTVEE